MHTFVSHELGSTVLTIENCPVIESGHETPSDELSHKPPARTGWFRLGFLLVNVWLVFHLFAIIICPASVEPSSPLIQKAFAIVAPYLHFLYLDHGFHFFAPDPGASTLVAYTLEFADGTTKTGRFPDRSISPRLLYHRYFMLTEFLGNGPEELQPLIERAFARNLCRTTGAVRVTLTKILHHTASVEDVRDGLTLNDPRFYKETVLGSYTKEELDRPMVPKTEHPDTPAGPVEPTDAANPPKDTP
jgi:hypothetical protein